MNTEKEINQIKEYIAAQEDSRYYRRAFWGGIVSGFASGVMLSAIITYGIWIL